MPTGALLCPPLPAAPVQIELRAGSAEDLAAWEAYARKKLIHVIHSAEDTVFAEVCEHFHSAAGAANGRSAGAAHPLGPGTAVSPLPGQAQAVALLYTATP